MKFSNARPGNCVLLVGMVLALGARTVLADNDWRTQVSTAAEQELERHGLPSLQIAIGYRGETLFDEAFGLASVEHQVPATAATAYRTASISKWLTATAALRLAEAGKLDLDGPVQTYCADFPQKRWPITPRQLLTHTSGVRHYADYEAQLEAAETDAARAEVERRRVRSELGRFTRYVDVTEPLRNFRDDPLQFEPGTDWQYSSFGYRLLACVLEGAAGDSYNSLLTKLVLAPARMESTVPDDAWAIVPDRADGYRVGGDLELRRADLRDVSENLPAGGHLATANDLVAFAMAFRAGDLVSAESVNLMRTPTRPIDSTYGPPSWRDAIPGDGKYGYGVMHFPSDDGDLWFGHSGQQAGTSTIVMQHPETDLTIAVMTNAKGWRGYISFTGELQRILSTAGIGIVD